MYKKHEYVEEAWNAAIGASALIMRYVKSGFDVKMKADGSPVTQADMESGRMISDWLKASGMMVLSEEEEPEGYERRRSEEWIWIVDPLDGTKEFARGGTDYTVNIGLVYGQRPVMGVIVSPATNEGWWGCEGMGAWFVQAVQEVDSMASLQKMSRAIIPTAEVGDALRITGTRSHQTEETLRLYEIVRRHYPQSQFGSMGSSLKFCEVASGNADVYIRTSGIHEWDTAAGDAIVRASGGAVVSLSDGLPLLYNKECLRQPSFVAAGLSTYEKLSALWPELK
ncbi:MAG: 3'(2'),5'-bisphosphate nucleotidase CysQ [Candidatus Competibacteraceae bacterium]|nr:3'(2'),5'-bisphosphate nucleotidase CysQ [Candidatus Competibacteraceae bacterium]